MEGHTLMGICSNGNLHLIEMDLCYVTYLMHAW